MRQDRQGQDAHVEYRLLGAAAVDGSLDADSAAVLEAHLAVCEVCRADHEAMVADHGWLAEPAAATWPRAEVRSFIMEAARASGIPRTSERRRSMAPLLAMGAVVVLIGVVGLGLGQRGPSVGSPSHTVAASGPGVLLTEPGRTLPVPTRPGATPSPGRTGGAATPVPISTSPIPRTGERIPIWPSPPATFPADTPFYLGQGYCFDSTDVDPETTARDPGTAVDFIIDGTIKVAQQELFVPGEGVCVVGTGWIVNVPTGLPAGTHHFEAHWYLAGVLDQVRTANVLFQ